MKISISGTLLNGEPCVYKWDVSNATYNDLLEYLKEKNQQVYYKIVDNENKVKPFIGIYANGDKLLTALLSYHKNAIYDTT